MQRLTSEDLKFGLVLACMGLSAWYLWPTSKPPVGTVTVAAPAPAMKYESKVPTPIKAKHVRAYTAKAKAKINLPEAVAKDADQVVTDSVLVKADSHDTQVTSVFNLATGATNTYVERQPYPLLAKDTHGFVWGGMLQTSFGYPVMGVVAGQNLVAIKGVKVTGLVMGAVPVGVPGKAFGMVGIGGRYDW